MQQPSLISEPNDPNSPFPFATLDELLAYMYAMTDDILAPSGSNMVICRGNPQAKLMVVGEAPGVQENKQGKPFVGPAGQMLDKVLQAIDLNPETDVFISNSVFRLPPGEAGKAFRKPFKEEVDHYRPFAQEIIRLVDPPLGCLCLHGVTLPFLSLGNRWRIPSAKGTKSLSLRVLANAWNRF